MFDLFRILAQEAHEEEHNPIIPALHELIFGTIAFLLLLLLLWRFGVFKKIREALEERRQKIEGNIEQAERTRQEAEALLAQYRQQLEESRDEAQKIIREARESGDQLRKDLQARAQEEANRIVESAKAEIQAERQRAASELRQEVGQLAVQVAERVVGGSLDGDRQLQLVDRYIEELQSAPNGGGNGSGRAGG